MVILTIFLLMWVNQENVYLMPSNFSFEEAACFRVASQSAYVALVERGNICSQDFVIFKTPRFF